MTFRCETFSRCEHAAYLHARATWRVRHQSAYTAPRVIDARMKPNYPDELFTDSKTQKTVDDRWREYFPDRSVAMGDSDQAHLD